MEFPTLIAERTAEIWAKVTYWLAGFTGVAWLTLGNVALVIGVIATVFTASVNYHYQKKRDCREEAKARLDGIQI